MRYTTTTITGLTTRMSRASWWLAGLLGALLTAMLVPRDAHAQLNNPRVRISPASGGYAAGAQVTVTIQYCSRWGFDMTTESLTNNNQPVSLAGSTTTTGTQADCDPVYQQFERRNVVITLGRGGNAVRARIENNPDGVNGNGDGTMGQALVSYTTPWPHFGVSLVADNRYVDVRASTTRAERHTITNTSEDSATFAISCTWSRGTGCTPSQTAVTLNPGASQAITTTVAVGAVGDTATLGVTVSGGGGPFPASANAITSVTAVAAPSTTRGVSLVNAAGMSERDLCVTIKAGNDAAMECGDLRLAHALPSIRTKGKSRTPVLLYNSALAEPTVTIPAHVALGAGFDPGATISATVVLTSPAIAAGTSFPAGTWAASDWPASGEPQRIVAAFAGDTLPTAKYGYRLEIRRSTDATVDVAYGRLLHVNRSRSPMHAGWWLAGLEQLVVADSNQLMTVGGDGSTRLYARTGSGCTHKIDHPIDRTERVTCAGAWRTRELPNGLRVVFDSTGRHRYTVNRLGDTTEFTYDGQGALASIVVPPRSGGVGVASYVFHYGASGLLDSVSAPPLSATVPRRVKITWTTGRAMLGGASGGRVLALRDPDYTQVQLHYQNEMAGAGEYRPASRVDRRLTTTTFGYGPAGKLASASTPASATQTVTQAFRPAEGVGIGTAVPLDSVYTRLDGPRTDVADVSKWWVNGFGAPLRVRDPMGVETTITYDATWRGLAAETRGPTGLRTTATYNGRGLPVLVTAVSPLASQDTAQAVTRYIWNTTWDMPDTVKAPTGEITVRSYDTRGNVLWEQAGKNAARRVHFRYDDTTRQLIRAQYPGITGADTIEYDAVLRNVSKTTSPGGRWVRRYADALGRDTLIESPIDATRSTKQRVTYDIADQVIETRTLGPAMPYTLPYGSSNMDTAPVLPETLVVLTDYDAAGNVTRIQKLATPNPRPWTNLCTAPRPNTQCAGLTAADTGSVDVRTYDGVHRVLTQRLGAAGGRYTYDPAGNAVQWISWENLVTTMQYDAANRRVRTAVGGRTFAQEGCDQIPSGPLYGPPNCLRRFPIYPNNALNGLTVPADTSRFAFDQAGLLRGAYNAYARIDRSYLPSGVLATDTLRLRDYAGAGYALTYGIRHLYDLSGRRVMLRTPWTADSVRYLFNDADSTGALTGVWQGNARVRFTYDLAGRQDSLLIGNASVVGVREGRAYDADGMLLRRERVSGQLGSLVKDSLVYDLRDKALDVTTWSRAIDVGTLEYHTRYSGLGAVLAQQKYKTGSAWEMEEFRTNALGDVYRSRTYRASGDNEGAFPLLGTMNQFGALIARMPVRDTINYPGAQLFEDTTYAHVDDAGNVDWSGTSFRSMSWGGRVEQAHTRSWFGADNRLRFQQRYTSSGTVSGSNAVAKGSWEEHWYDALGRKVLTRARRDSLCMPTTNDSCQSYIERTIWDGDQVLYEMRTQGGDNVASATLNADVSTATAQLGKVGYVHAGGIDAPLVLMDGRVPTYNWRGLAESSVWLDGAAADCTVSPLSGGSPCTTIYWPGNQSVYMKPPLSATSLTGAPTWVGSLLNNGVGSTGMAYRRNRFYDGATGQFNQQDPIGLAGGANSYGFAGGDPVTYSDPFGLCRSDDTACLDLVKQLRREKGPEFHGAADRLERFRSGRVRWVAGNHPQLNEGRNSGLNRDGDPRSWVAGHVHKALSTDIYLNQEFEHGDRLIAAVHEAQHLDGLQDVRDRDRLLNTEARAYNQLSDNARAGAPRFGHRLCGQGRVGQCPSRQATEAGSP